jgi:hypothetical protein
MNFIWNWLLGKAKDYLLRNWKTTVVGVLGAILSRYIPDITEEQRGAILAAVVALVAGLSKDGDTSGTTAQPRLAPEKVEVLDRMAEDIPSSAHGGP